MQNRHFILLLSIFALFNANHLKAQQKDIYTFSANKLTYSQDNNIIEATGNVFAKNQEGKQISSDKIIYNKKTNKLITFGNSKL
jgi:lipopolysaccharide assembly outer membrane protein LptD (OstA)